MHESDEQFLERFLVEIEPAVQPIGRITDARLVETAGSRRVGIEVVVEGRFGPIELLLEGDSLVDAAAGFAARIAETRLALTFREVVLA